MSFIQIYTKTQLFWENFAWTFNIFPNCYHKPRNSFKSNFSSFPQKHFHNNSQKQYRNQIFEILCRKFQIKLHWRWLLWFSIDLIPGKFVTLYLDRFKLNLFFDEGKRSDHVSDSSTKLTRFFLSFVISFSRTEALRIAISLVGDFPRLSSATKNHKN